MAAPTTTGKKVSQIAADHARWRDEQPSAARCAFCPDWFAVGTVAEVREAFEAHHAETHPERVRRRKRRGEPKDPCSTPDCPNACSVVDGAYAGKCRVCRDTAMRGTERGRVVDRTFRPRASERRRGRPSKITPAVVERVEREYVAGDTLTATLERRFRERLCSELGLLSAEELAARLSPMLRERGIAIRKGRTLRRAPVT